MKNLAFHKKLSHFFTCRSLIARIKNLNPKCFADVNVHCGTFQLFADPFSEDVDSVSCVVQMEVVDLQWNSKLKSRFRVAQGNTHNTISEKTTVCPSFYLKSSVG